MTEEEMSKRCAIALISRAREIKNAFEMAMAQASSPDHKLTIMANYGDIALTLLPGLCDELEARSF